jgi:DNA-directed RNA polymerase subunit RPC12/RpoP
MPKNKKFKIENTLSLKCEYCGSENHEGSTTLLECYWTTPTYSCTGGGDTVLSHYAFVCSTCNKKNKLYFEKEWSTKTHSYEIIECDENTELDYILKNFKFEKIEKIYE